MEKLESTKRNSGKNGTISVSKRLFFSLFTSQRYEVGLENITCGAGIVDNQGKQQIKVYIKIARAFHRLSITGVSIRFSVKGPIVNTLDFAGHKGSVTIT